MSSSGSPALPYTVRVDQAHLLAAALMFALSWVGVAYQPKVLFWIPLLPVVFIVWTLRCRTTFTEQGITARYLFRPTKSLAWEDFEALRFTKGGKALAVGRDDSTFALPGVSFNSLVTLAEVTDGRIPDPVTPTLETIDESIRVVERDSGTAVLMDEEEYAEYEANRRTSHMAREELARRQREREGREAAGESTTDMDGTGSTGGISPDPRES
ncbi:MAG TPA: PH domain-containing protein [Candidatus Corynebacterium avicola]|uniref:PH domain-containing protein n=1 Tax=Candidatus Corynebacterium avicola TaxID=2838527 RepID=A0A9D1RMX0_9CORY|nr:PH domain-containing protein [Candidatus Corynebacterium avicola]